MNTDKSYIEDIYKTCKYAIDQANQIALEFWGKVTNEGKEFDNNHGSKQDIARITAKSEIDDRIQDLFLGKLIENSQTDYIAIDTEEQTKLVSKFKEDAPSTLVLDPLDGSLEYINRELDFSINVALISQKKIEFSIVSFPAMNVIFENHGSQKYTMEAIDPQNEFNHESRFDLVENKDNSSESLTVHYNRRVSKKILHELADQQIKTEPSNGLYLPILAIMKGECNAVIAGTPQIRDILLHEILAGMHPDIFEIYNFRGDPINWYSKQRLDNYVFAKKGMRKFLQF